MEDRGSQRRLLSRDPFEMEAPGRSSQWRTRIIELPKFGETLVRSVAVMDDQTGLPLSVTCGFGKDPGWMESAAATSR